MAESCNREFAQLITERYKAAEILDLKRLANFLTHNAYFLPRESFVKEFYEFVASQRGIDDIQVFQDSSRVFLKGLDLRAKEEIGTSVKISGARSFARQETTEEGGDIYNWQLLGGESVLTGSFEGFAIMRWYDVPKVKAAVPVDFTNDHFQRYPSQLGLAISLQKATSLVDSDGTGLKASGEHGAVLVPLEHGFPEIYAQ